MSYTTARAPLGRTWRAYEVTATIEGKSCQSWIARAIRSMVNAPLVLARSLSMGFCPSPAPDCLAPMPAMAHLPFEPLSSCHSMAMEEGMEGRIREIQTATFHPRWIPGWSGIGATLWYPTTGPLPLPLESRFDPINKGGKQTGGTVL